ncbi:hypothetical protein J6590_084803 [Homalodisca vitripennis]|nr:hypothetical protein J6590_084803 [Homalodisca vitripennis]
MLPGQDNETGHKALCDVGAVGGRTLLSVMDAGNCLYIPLKKAANLGGSDCVTIILFLPLSFLVQDQTRKYLTLVSNPWREPAGIKVDISELQIPAVKYQWTHVPGFLKLSLRSFCH